MPNLKGWEWLIIIALILLLFGAKRLPDAARGLGRSLRIFKAETKGLSDGESANNAGEVQAGGAPAPLPQQDAAAQPPQDTSASETTSQSVPTERSEG
jgi:sec-independent protein translocase protein TatA